MSAKKFVIELTWQEDLGEIQLIEIRNAIDHMIEIAADHVSSPPESDFDWYGDFPSWPGDDDPGN